MNPILRASETGTEVLAVLRPEDDEFPFFEPLYRTPARAGIFLTAWENETAVGFCAAIPEDGLRVHKLTFFVYVRPASRKNGLGGRLLAAVLDLARLCGYRTASLSAERSEGALAKLLDRFAFHQTGYEPNDFYTPNGWICRTVWQRPLSDYPASAPTPRALSDLPREEIEKLIF